MNDRGLDFRRGDEVHDFYVPCRVTRVDALQVLLRTTFVVIAHDIRYGALGDAPDIEVLPECR